jgi:hypothetical protein
MTMSRTLPVLFAIALVAAVPAIAHAAAPNTGGGTICGHACDPAPPTILSWPPRTQSHFAGVWSRWHPRYHRYHFCPSGTYQSGGQCYPDVH